MANSVNKQTKATEQGADFKNDDDLPRLVDMFSTASLALNGGKVSEMIYLFCTSQGKSVKAHKCLLAQNSPVFASMFVNAEMMGQDVVAINDMDYNVLEEMVRFVYSGKVRNIDTLAYQLAVAADTYALNGLKIMCEKALIKNLNLNNIIVRLELADRLGMNQLKETALEFAVENAGHVSMKREFQMLPGNVLSELFRRLAQKIR